jgi:putative PEP-CTERM system TPR-repeat lipoprotein
MRFELENRQPVPRALRVRVGRRLKVATLFVVLLAACGVTGEKLLARAEAAIAEGRFRSAMIDLQNYIREHPEEARPRALLALVLAELSDMGRAQVEVRKAKDLGAPRELTIVPECRVLVGTGKLDQALEECTFDGASPELNGTLTAIRGSAQYQLGRYADARGSFERALALNPNDLNALLGAAEATKRAGDLTAAREIYDRAPEGLRRQPGYWRGLGYLEQSSGHPDRAEKAYQAAIGLYDPKDDSDELLATLGLLTETQIRLGRKPEAAATADRMLKLAPDSSGAKYYAGLAAEAQGNLEQARTLYEEAALNRGWLQPRIALARANFQLGKYNQAESILKDVLNQDPDNQVAMQMRDLVRSRLQSPAEALRQLEPQLESSPDDVDLALRATQLSLRSGDTNAARSYMQQAEAAARTPEEKTKVAAGYVAIGDYDRAVALLESIPGPGEATRFRKEVLTIVALLRKGDRDAAIDRAEGLLAGEPDEQTRSVAAAIFAQAGDYRRAREQYTQLLAARPDDTATQLRLADVEIRAGELDAAAGQLQSVLQRDARNEQATLTMARVAMLRRDSGEAERWARKARGEHPQSLGAQLAFAQQMLANRKLDDAKDGAEAAVRLAPTDPQALTMLGAVQNARGELSASTATFRRIVEKSPRVVSYRLNLSRALLREGKGKEALQVIDQALQAEPRNPQLLGAAVMFALQGGDVERAAGYSARLSQLDPEPPVAVRLEARVAIAQKRYGDAVELLDRAAQTGLDAQLVGERFQAARLAKLPDAERELNSWLEAHPEDVQLRILLADHLGAKGDTTGARKQYEAVLERAPRSVVAQNNLAVLYQQQGDPRAAELARSAYQGAPANPLIADTYGWILVEKGDVGPGVEILRKAAANPAATPEIHYHLAEGLSRQGRRDEALGILRKLSMDRGAGYDAVRTRVERLIAEIER